jgi:hypothetical protein
MASPVALKPLKGTTPGAAFAVELEVEELELELSPVLLADDPLPLATTLAPVAKVSLAVALAVAFPVPRQKTSE